MESGIGRGVWSWRGADTRALADARGLILSLGKELRRSISIGLAAACLTGCALQSKTAGNDAPASQQYKVTADATPFYRLGPQQPSGPDLSLKKDTRITLVKRSYGYSSIQMLDGQRGIVATEDIAALSPQELAATSTAATTSKKSKHRPRGDNLPIPSDLGEPALPSRAETPPANAPKFRF